LESLPLIFVTSFLIALSGALVPGPMLTVTLADAPRRGFLVGPLMVLGHGILEAALICLLLAGLGPFLNRSVVIAAVGLAGGALLGWLGWDMIRSSGGIKFGVDREWEGRSHHPITYGVLTSLSNPYWTLWWATIGLGYLAAALKFGGIGVVVFFTGHILADLAWYSAVSFAISRGKRFLGDRLYRRLVLGCGIFLILFGSWFIRFGWKNL